MSKQASKSTQQAPDMQAMIAAAVAAALAGQQAPAAATPNATLNATGKGKGKGKGKQAPAAAVAPVVLQTRLEKFESYLSPDQARELEGLFALAAEHMAANRATHAELDQRAESMKAKARAIIAKVWAKPCDWQTWDNVRSAAYAYGIDGKLLPAPTAGETRTPNVAAMYWGKCLAEAYKAAHGALPVKKEGTSHAGKGMSPKRAANGFATRVADVLEYVATLKANDVNAAILERIQIACTELVAATAALKAAVNE